jgi:hypothetical protein
VDAYALWIIDVMSRCLHIPSHLDGSWLCCLRCWRICGVPRAYSEHGRICRYVPLGQMWTSARCFPPSFCFDRYRGSIRIRTRSSLSFGAWSRPIWRIRGPAIFRRLLAVKRPAVWGENLGTPLLALYLCSVTGTVNPVQKICSAIQQGSHLLSRFRNCLVMLSVAW